MEFGWLSLLPPLIAIVLALITKEVLISLFIAVFLGGIILTGSLVGGFANALNTQLVGALTDSWNISILIFCLSIGGLIGIIDKNGGTRGIAQLLVKKSLNAKSAMLSTFFLGLAIFFDDYANSLIVGNTMKGITDNVGVSREKLAYIIDSTAAPVSSMAFISTWVGMEVGLIQSGLSKLNLDMGAYDVFFKSIPYRFYSILALVFVFMVILLNRDFGPMLKAEKKAILKQKISPDLELEDERTSHWINAVFPILIVLVTTLLGLYYNGGGFTGIGLSEAFSNADASVVLLWASFLGLITAAIQSVLGKRLTLKETSEAFVEGVQSMAVPAMILSLAWALGNVNEALGTANYMVSILGKNVAPFLIPLLMFIIPALVAFATGTSWGTNAIVMPMAIPLAYMSGGSSLMVATIGAVLTGAVMGDHISPISDTTIMSSMASGCDHLSHVKTQMPYALFVAFVSILFGFIPAGLGLSPIVSILLSSLGLGAGLLYFGEKTREC